MSTLFDPKLHPRDRLGQFRDVLSALRPGEKVRLPDGTAVRRLHRPSGNRGYHVSPVGDFTDPDKGELAIKPEQAAEVALNFSAQKVHPRAVGGTVRYRTHQDADSSSRDMAKGEPRVEIMVNGRRVGGNVNKVVGDTAHVSTDDGEVRKVPLEDALPPTRAGLHPPGTVPSSGARRDNPKLPGAPHPEDVAAKAAKARKAAKLPSRKERTANEKAAGAKQKLERGENARLGNYLLRVQKDGSVDVVRDDGVGTKVRVGDAAGAIELARSEGEFNRRVKRDERRAKDESPMPGVIRKPSESDAIRAEAGRKKQSRTGDKAASAAWRNQLRDLKDGGKSITIQSPSGSLQIERKGDRYTVRNLRTYTEHQADRAGTESWIQGLLGKK